MKKCTFLLLFSAVICFSVYAQKEKTNPELKPLSASELEKLASIPELVLPAGSSDDERPYAVDNSQLPYFRPLYQQSGLECGQASSLGLGLTYELNCARNLPGNVPANQQATHFAFNFINGGGDCGVSYFETWYVVKNCGNPNVQEYGGTPYYGGSSRWMSGYDLYYNAMKNRIRQMFAIKVNTEEGLNTLKGWLYNHLNGSAHGGVAQMYISYTSPGNTLPTGTPEAGKHVILSFGGSPNHGLTIVGYNDSIRWDFNNDGQYTNNLDTNGDGIVDMKDWEVGGYKVANTYGGINTWGDQGFSYVMYRTFAEQLEEGGIWNSAVHGVYVNENYDPQLTIKATVTHSNRSKIKIIPGIALYQAATEPDFTLDLPIFDFQGGDLYMQGGSSTADKTLEFGLDITPLLSYIQSGSSVKIFLQLAEDDPSNAATGKILSFSVMDYTGTGIVEYPCSQTNVPIVENGITTLDVNLPLSFNKTEITTDSLPLATLYQPYDYTLSALGGRPPYQWETASMYSERDSTATFPLINAHQVNLSGTENGIAEQPLDFSFPYYGKMYDKVYVHGDGYLMFTNEDYPWTFIIAYKSFMKNIKAIAPFSLKTVSINAGDGDGVWYEGDANCAAFRWKASLWDNPSGTDLNFAIKIYPSGKIEFYYGEIVSVGYLQWFSGISEGNGYDYILRYDYGDQPPAANSVKKYSSTPYPYEMQLSSNGEFSGAPMQVYDSCMIKFVVTDNNNIRTIKTLPFTTKGLGITYNILSGGDDVVEYAEEAALTLMLNNTNTQPFQGTEMWLKCNDSLIQLTDSTENVGTIPASQSVSFSNAFGFTVADVVPEGYAIPMTVYIASLTDTLSRQFTIILHSPVLTIGNITINDGANGSLDPGETADMIVELKNTGGAKATGILANINCINPEITVNNAHFQSDTLSAGATLPLVFNITASSGIAIGNVVTFPLSIQTDYDYGISDTLAITVGLIAETFESGNFSSYDWQFSGNADWQIVETNPYEGTYCAKSGAIADNQESVFYITLNVLADGEISFYKKVSCENAPSGTGYDWLGFYIDNNELNKWDGEVSWSQETYPVTAGEHTLKWVYHKDYSTIGGSDCAWVDYIIFPAFDNGTPNMTVTPNIIEKDLDINQIDADTLVISNLGGGYIDFNISVPDSMPWLSVVPATGHIGMYGSYPVQLIFNTNSVPPGSYSGTFTVSDQIGNTKEVPVNLKVTDPNGINNFHGSESCFIFPNPAKNVITLQINEQINGNFRIELFKPDGLKVFSSEGNIFSYNKFITLNLSNLNSGIYFCKLQISDRTFINKIIITR
ncbi:MAG: T9SS type A sorting domain-containing protein [Lentimicrobiaceae bacterium]|nr:T9SS type A sorting domain-containing protein [Lentimicrobiaceae bacterium]